MKKENRKKSSLKEHSPPDDDERRRIRAILRKPMNKRTHFLRVRRPDGGSSI